MKLGKLVKDNKCAFPETIAKAILTETIINDVIETFSQKTSGEWVEYPCDKCTPNSKCKRHKVLDFVLNTAVFTKIKGFNTPDGIVGVLADKYYLVCYNPKEEMLLIINTPSIVDKDNIISDRTVKKLNVFIYSGIKDLLSNISIEGEVDLDEIKENQILETRFEASSDQILKLIKVYSTFVWEIIDIKENK